MGDLDLLPALAAWPLGVVDSSRFFIGPLARMANDFGGSIAEAARRVRSLIPGNSAWPEVDFAQPSDRIVTKSELAILSRDFDGDAPWIEGDLSPMHLMSACENLGEPIDRVLEVCDRLASLGVSTAGRDLYPEVLDPIERQALGCISIPGQKISILQLIAIAGRVQVSIAEVYRSLAGLEMCGMLSRPEFDTQNDFIPSLQEISFVDYRLGMSDMSEESSPFVMIAGDVASELKRVTLDQSSVRRLIPLMSPKRPVIVQEIVRTAYECRTTLSGAVDLLREIYPQAELPTIPSECADLKVSYAVYTALLGHSGRYVWQAGPGDIVCGAQGSFYGVHEFIGVLAPFRSLVRQSAIAS